MRSHSEYSQVWTQFIVQIFFISMGINQASLLPGHLPKNPERNLKKIAEIYAIQSNKLKRCSSDGIILNVSGSTVPKICGYLLVITPCLAIIVELKWQQGDNLSYKRLARDQTPIKLKKKVDQC